MTMPEAILDSPVRRILHYRATLTETVTVSYGKEYPDEVFEAGTEGWASTETKGWWRFMPDNPPRPGYAVLISGDRVDVDLDKFIEPVYTLQERFYALEGEEVEND